MEKLTTKGTSSGGVTTTGVPSLLGLIRERMRSVIETILVEELDAALSAPRYARVPTRRGERNGARERTLVLPAGPMTMLVPRGRILDAQGQESEWRSNVLPRYRRRVREVDEALAGAYLGGMNTRRIRGALRPLLRDSGLSKSAVSRVVGAIKGEFEAWRKRDLHGDEVVFLYLDGVGMRVRLDRKVVRVPVLVALGVGPKGEKVLLDLRLAGSERTEAWTAMIEDLEERGLRAPRLVIIDGHAGLRAALEATWPGVPVQRCTVHKTRNLLTEVHADFRNIVYASNIEEAHTAWKRFEKRWESSCPGVVRSLREGGEELLTFFGFPASQWKSLRTTNAIERLNEEFRRRVKTQGSLPGEDAVLPLLFALVVSGQIVMRRMNGWEEMVHVVRRPLPNVA